MRVSLSFATRKNMTEAGIVELLRFKFQRSLSIPSDSGLSKWRILPSLLSSFSPSISSSSLPLPLSSFPLLLEADFLPLAS